MDWKTKIVEKTKKGKTWYQPQVKPDCWYSFLLGWDSLTMLILDDELNECDLKTWTLIKKEAETELDRFIHFQD